MRAIFQTLSARLPPHPFSSPVRPGWLTAFLFFALASLAVAQVSQVPENLGLGLRQLVESSHSDPAQLKTRVTAAPSINADAAGRVLVNVQLNGQVLFAEVQKSLAGLGAVITAADEHWRNGVISAWLPLAGAEATALLPGVRSITLARKPVRRIGAVTAQSSSVERAGEVNAPGVVTAQGIIGRGISIGLISDSFDTATNAPRAEVTVAAGDLPGPGNPDGYTQPVVVLQDDSSPDATDEGRGMAEIVHDIAPAAKLSFSAAGNTQTAMAASIRNLRTSSQTQCDVIVDDIGFPDEPFFSDGLIAQAIDDVATSNSLPGKKVAYFSAAGNSDNHGYVADANIISATAAPRGNLNFSKVPPALYAGGFQNLNASGAPAIIMTLTTDTDPVNLIFQWDDPFNTGGVTTDYNLLVFNSSGVYLGNISGTDNNFSTSQPLEIVDLGPNTTYQVVISLASSSAPTARHLALVAFGGGGVTGDYWMNDVIAVLGHPAAANANAVGAYVYNTAPDSVPNYNPGHVNPPPGPYQPGLESFSALGGSVPFYFNAQGQRLPAPELRLKPEFAAADGIDTSFFPTDAGADTDNDGFPNFFGTSASAPNAAGFAALILEAAGGPSSLTPLQLRDKLEHSTFPHDLDPDFSQGLALIDQNSNVQLTATGDDSNESATSPNFFNLAFTGPNDGRILSQITIDLARTALVFDQATDLGFPFTVGQNDGGVSVTATVSPDERQLTLDFGASFTPGKTISFGIDRDLAGINAGGNSADLLGGASVSVVTKSGPIRFTALNNQLGSGFIPADGYGLIDVRLAVESIVGHKASFSGVSANLSTRGLAGLGNDALFGGLIVDGSGAKKIIARAIGPSLPLAGRLADPTLTLFDQNGAPLASNDNWQDDPVEAAKIKATGIPPTDADESAIVRSVNPGNYTAIVTGANSTTGLAVVEIYDLDPQPAPARLANIATRGLVESGDDVMIAGFILQQGTSEIVVRAIAPSVFGLSPAAPAALDDPVLELHDNQGNLLQSNDNWQETPFQAVQLTGIGLAPTSGVESALLTTLSPNNYTAIVRGAHGTTGHAVVEVYNVR